MATIKASPFRLALIQLGGTGKNKTANLAHAREMVLKAAKGVEGGEKAQLVVLPVRSLLSSPFPLGHSSPTLTLFFR